jgi:spectinomycin phosphotransferase
VRSPPADLQVDELASVVRREWRLPVGRLDHLPEGGGAYHWVAQATDGRRWFVTCDDLDTKPWLGADRDSVFAGLLAAYGAAMHLRTAGADFVVAPAPTRSGEPAFRVDDGHGLAVFPYVAGDPGRWGQPIAPDDRRRLVRLLAELHRSERGVAPALPRRGLEVPGRRSLDAALESLDRPWNGGPLSEAGRRQLAGHAEDITGWLAVLDRLAADVDSRGGEAVVTHGEPHPGNLIRTHDGFALVDWDTVAAAGPERDLWMLDDSTGEARAIYEDLSGRALDPLALTAYRRLWALSDVAAFTIRLRSPHQQNPDTEHALSALRRTLTGEEPIPYGDGPARAAPA